MVSTNLLIIGGILLSLQLILIIIAVQDWLNQSKEMPNRVIWLIIIVLINIIGPIIYFIAAPRSGKPSSDNLSDSPGWEKY